MTPAKTACLTALSLLALSFAYAQDDAVVDNADAAFNIDSLFDAPSGEQDVDSGGKGAGLLEQVILSRGFSMTASYKALGFIAPGWYETPWYPNTAPSDKEGVSFKPGVALSADLNLDIQVSDVLRVQQSIAFQVLDPQVKIEEFFLDYNAAQKVFVRMGQFNVNWGQSHNFQFTNLLARIPVDAEEKEYAPRYLKVNVPVGIGGFEAVMSGRFVKDFEDLKPSDFGYGIKYNFIQPRVDMDIGFFYYAPMPLRGFFTLQTTVLKSTEFYIECLVSIPHEKEFFGFKTTKASDVTFSGSIGALWTLFSEKLDVNAELFYSGEKETRAIDKNALNIIDEDEKVFTIMRELNAALNLRFEPGGLRGLGSAVGFRWSFFDMSGQVVPALYLKPAKHVQVSFAMPIALGERKNADGSDTYYFQNNPDGTKRPFSMIFAISLNSEYRFGHYE